MSVQAMNDDSRAQQGGRADAKMRHMRLADSRNNTSALMAEYDLVLCSRAEQLREALDIRLTVFHQEQGFPADTEVDEYDPMSAHFLLLRREDGQAIGTVRLTPYPRQAPADRAKMEGQDNVSKAGTTTDCAAPKTIMGQDETSIVQSGGGPQGTSGGLPMFSSTAPETKTRGTLPETASDTAAREELPLGRPLPLDVLVDSFVRRIEAPKDHPFKESAADAPVVRGAKLSRLAVSRSERGRGCGALLVRQAEAWFMGVMRRIQSSAPATIQEPMGIVLSSQMPVVGFYQALGYTQVGEPYDEEGAPHTWCLKELAKVQK